MKNALVRMLWVVGVATLVLGGRASADVKDDLKESFKKRLPEIEALKHAGKLGETYDGWVEAVKNAELTEKQQKVVSDENKDRRTLYGLIAEEEKTTPGKVAERNALRNYRTGRPGEWFKLKNGQWKQKERE